MKNNIPISKKRELEGKAIRWCADNDRTSSPFNVISALCAMGCIKEKDREEGDLLHETLEKEVQNGNVNISSIT